MKQEQRNGSNDTARFWVYINLSWVKLTVKRGQELRHRIAYPTDEGFYAHEESFYIYNGLLYREQHTQQRDCDGLHHDGLTLVARLSELRADAHPEDRDGTSRTDPNGCIYTPNWLRERELHRDFTAEAAGY